MRITIVMGYFLPVPALAGGATEQIWHRIGELMADTGHEVTIISRQWPTLPTHERVGRITHVRLPGWNHTRSLPINLLLDFRGPIIGRKNLDGQVRRTVEEFL